MVTGIRYPNHRLRGGEFFHFHFVNHKLASYTHVVQSVKLSFSTQNL